MYCLRPIRRQETYFLFGDTLVCSVQKLITISLTSSSNLPCVDCLLHQLFDNMRGGVPRWKYVPLRWLLSYFYFLLMIFVFQCFFMRLRNIIRPVFYEKKRGKYQNCSLRGLMMKDFLGTNSCFFYCKVSLSLSHGCSVCNMHLKRKLEGLDLIFHIPSGTCSESSLPVI